MNGVTFLKIVLVCMACIGVVTGTVYFIQWLTS